MYGLYESEDLVNIIPLFEMKDIQTTDGVRIKTRKAIFSDRGEFIEVVSNRYNLLQPREVLKKIIESGKVRIAGIVYSKGKFIYEGFAKKMNGEESEYKVVFRNSVDKSNSFMVLILGKDSFGGYDVPLVFTRIIHTNKDIEEIAKGLTELTEKLLEKAEERKKILEELKEKEEMMAYLRERVYERFFKKLKKGRKRIKEKLKEAKDVAELYKTALTYLIRDRKKEFSRKHVATVLGRFIVEELEKAQVFAKL